MGFDVLLSVPYLSQWDAEAHLARGDCGIVAACMIARWKGIDTTPDRMLVGAGLPVGKHSYTFSEVVTAGKHVGLTFTHHKPAPWADIRAELDAGRPVISLLRYGRLSGNQDDFDGSHFVVVVGYGVGCVYLNDPDWWYPRRKEGARRIVPLHEFEDATGNPLIATGNQPYQSLFLG